MSEANYYRKFCLECGDYTVHYRDQFKDGCVHKHKELTPEQKLDSWLAELRLFQDWLAGIDEEKKLRQVADSVIRRLDYKAGMIELTNLRLNLSNKVG